MKDKSQYDHMLELGSWLELLLNSKMNQETSFFELAEKGIRYLDIEYDIKDDDIVLNKLEEANLQTIIKDRPDLHRIRDYLIAAKDDPEVTNDEAELILLFECGYDNPINTISERGQNLSLWPILEEGVADDYKPDREDRRDLTVSILAKEIALSIFQLKRDIYALFKWLCDMNTSWNIALAKLSSAQGEKLHPSLIRILKSYRGLSEVVKPYGHDMKRTLEFVANYSIDVMPWDVLISRIFFDFLFSGGAEYYGFCDHCGKFYIVKRKGRKKYCSHICRTYASKERRET